MTKRTKLRRKLQSHAVAPVAPASNAVHDRLGDEVRRLVRTEMHDVLRSAVDSTITNLDTDHERVIWKEFKYAVEQTIAGFDSYADEAILKREAALHAV